MKTSNIEIKKDEHATICNDAIEYINVHGTLIVNEGNLVHEITAFSGAEVQLNRLQGVSHVLAMNGSKVFVNHWEAVGCDIQLHIGGIIVNATDMPTEELLKWITCYSCSLFDVKPIINGNIITGMEVKHDC
jgi:hypothetical protein